MFAYANTEKRTDRKPLAEIVFFLHNLISHSMLKYILCWIPMVFIAVLNGAARDLWYKKYMTELTAHQLSTFSLIVLLGIYCYFVVKSFPPSSEKQALLIGMIWTVLTLAFEFGFGIIRGSSWKQLLQAYNFTEGQIWILIPIWVTVAPLLAYKIIK